jgi:hypothetical protein
MKTARTVLASSFFLGMAFGTAHAEVCYAFTGFSDRIRTAQTIFSDEAPSSTTVGPGTHTLVVGNWNASSAYSLPVVGSLDTGFNPPRPRLALHGGNIGSAFQGKRDCIINSTPGVSGGTSITCDGGPAGNSTGNFVLTNLTLATVSCDTLTTAPTPEGKALGE